MAERARLAKMPQPEGPLKCPRCDSTNTKFCYYNNYSLSQPRHFCKACRRYWTRGGALRNVPVGGGYRRNNKKGKSVNSNSKSSTSSSSIRNNNNHANKQASTVAAPAPGPTTNSQFPFFPALSQLGNIGLNLAAINGNIHQAAHMGLNMNDLGFLHVGTSAANNDNNNSNNIMTSNQFGLFDIPTTTGLSYGFQSEGNMGNNLVGYLSSSAAAAAARGSSQMMAPVKMEDINILSRPVSGLTPPANNSQTNNQYWTGSRFSGSSNDNNNHLL